ncbi:MAG: hypothetical protein GF393_02180 [Armatimonadia bacterium]|nr:hypothetical protein [Armatimonadia bacterium]
MTEAGNGTEGRPGCLIGRLLDAAARLVLVYPLICMGSAAGQSAQRALWPDLGTPYEGVLAGSMLGLIVGVSLWLSTRGTGGWRARLADATLATVTVVWLAALYAGVGGCLDGQGAWVPWTACLAGAAGIAMVLRA